MKIGELAERTGTTAETIRYYEQKGLLPEPDRTASNYREYAPEHEQRLRMIRNCRTLGMSHAEILELLSAQDSDSGDCSAVNRIVDEHLEHVREKIRVLQHLEIALHTLAGQCSGATSTEACGILKGLADCLAEPLPRSTHMNGPDDLHR
ncbi:MAG: Cd(II)/Pb(II)-responsive transcriptional regulator [Spirochaetaceae bacterium]|nr:MAG: Cd(II)/Pb(II)-responsive transcriptional regulator [Spirochaetaceae bacterium]